MPPYQFGDVYEPQDDLLLDRFYLYRLLPSPRNGLDKSVQTHVLRLAHPKIFWNRVKGLHTLIHITGHGIAAAFL